MSEEIKTDITETMQNASLDDLADFSIDKEAKAIIDNEKVTLATDLEGFAKGFPDWDLLPPKK